MDVRFVLMRDSALLAPLKKLKVELLWFLGAVERFQADDERPTIPPNLLEPIAQLEYATDNMIRILVSGGLRPEMFEAFAERVEAMGGQRDRFQEQIVLAIPEEADRYHLGGLMRGVVVREADVFENVRAMLRDDYGLELLAADDRYICAVVSEEERTALAEAQAAREAERAAASEAAPSEEVKS